MNQLAALDESLELWQRSTRLQRCGDSSLTMDHAISMRNRITSDFSEAKLGRWLGWVQASLVADCPDVGLEHMKAINMRHS